MLEHGLRWTVNPLQLIAEAEKHPLDTIPLQTRLDSDRFIIHSSLHSPLRYNRPCDQSAQPSSKLGPPLPFTASDAADTS